MPDRRIVSIQCPLCGEDWVHGIGVTCFEDIWFYRFLGWRPLQLRNWLLTIKFMT